MFLFITKNCLLENTMRRLLKALPLTLALAALSIVSISCNSTNSAQARFINAVYNTSTYGGSLDLEINGTKDFTNITFPNASASTYKAVPTGSDTFLGLQYNTTTQVFTTTTTLNGATQYTMVADGQAGGSGNGVTFTTFPDNNSVPTAGTVNFRVINASDFAQLVDVYIEQTPFSGSLGQNGVTPQVSGLAENSASSYVNLPWNSDGQGWTIFVTPAGNPGLIILNGFNTGDFGGTGSEAIRTLVLTNDTDAVSTMSSQPIVLKDLN